MLLIVCIKVLSYMIPLSFTDDSVYLAQMVKHWSDMRKVVSLIPSYSSIGWCAPRQHSCMLPRAFISSDNTCPGISSRGRAILVKVKPKTSPRKTPAPVPLESPAQASSKEHMAKNYWNTWSRRLCIFFLHTDKSGTTTRGNFCY